MAMGSALVDDRGYAPRVTEPGEVQRRSAQLTVARNAADADECRTLLDMLGLLPNTEESS